MLGVDKRGHAAGLLRFGDHLQGNGRLAGRFRAEDFDHASARETTHAEGRVEGNRAGGDNGNRNNGFFRSQPHNGALPKLLFDLGEREINCFGTFVGHASS